MAGLKAGRSVEVAVTGQLLLARPLHDSRHGPFLELVERVRNADVAITGFEGVLAGKGSPSPTATLHVAPRSVAETVAWMGFRLVGLAGNHAFDLGPEGIVNTIQVFAEHGLATSGTGKDPGETKKAAIFHTTAGRCVALLSRQLGPKAAGEEAVHARVRDDLPEPLGSRPGVAHIGVERVVSARPDVFAALAELLEESGYTALRSERAAMGAEAAAGDGLDAWGTRVVAGNSNSEAWRVDQAGLDDLNQRVRGISQSGANAVVHFHNHYWASNPAAVPGWFRETAASVGAVGAPLVIGHGYPGLQAFELAQGRLLAHGMGSLAFHTRRPQRYTGLQVWESVVVLVRLSSGGVCEKVELLPVVHGDHPGRARRGSELGEPELADFETGRAVLERLGARCASFGSQVVVRRAGGRAVGELVEGSQSADPDKGSKC